MIPAAHAITATGGHLDPTMFQRFAPGIMPLSVEEGIANGVPEVRKAVRHQLEHGAQVITISASGGVMSHSGAAGPAVLRRGARGDRRRGPPRRHPGRRPRPRRRRHPGVPPGGRRLIEHGSLASDETIGLMVEHGTFLVPTSYLSEGRDISRAAPELQAKAAEVFPKARAMLGKAIAAGVRIACGTDAPAIPHGANVKELWAMVDRGTSPLQAVQAATLTSAELIERTDDLGRLAPGYLADVIALPGDPTEDITSPRTSASS